MKPILSICLLVLAVNLAQCVPIPSDEDNNDQSEPFPQDQTQAKVMSLVYKAQAIVQKLKSQGKNSDVAKLCAAIACALEQIRAFTSMNMNREFGFSIQGVTNNLNNSKTKLEHLIDVLKN